MGKIGNLGKLIVFEVSSDKVLTFSKMSRTVKGRWTSHNIIAGKPQSEFLGADVQSVSLTIFLSSSHGVRPRKTLERIEKAVERGEHFPFVIGGKRVGTGDWKITSASETWDKVFNGGELIEAKVTLSLEEYI